MSEERKHKTGDRVTVQRGFNRGESGVVRNVITSEHGVIYEIDTNNGAHLGIPESDFVPTSTPYAPLSRPLPELMRELASAADADADGRVTVAADTVRAWADRIAELEAGIREALAHIGEYYESDFQQPIVDAECALTVALVPPPRD